MIDKIISGISFAVGSEFGDDYDIHKNGVKQGLTTPCFSILCLNPTIEQVLGKRYFRTNQFVVHYFPSTDEPQLECHSVTERLMGCLEYIDIDGDLVRGTGMTSEIVDDVLSFFVNYNMYVYKDIPAEPAMESVKYEGGAKA